MVNKSAIDLLAFASERAKHEYDDLQQTWRAIDTKAQASAAAAGVFLAGAFALLNNPKAPLAPNELFLLGLLFATLVFAIVLAIWCMIAKSVPTPPLTTSVIPMVRDALNRSKLNLRSQHPIAGLDEHLLCGVVEETLGPWQNANEETNRALATKACILTASHTCLVLAAILALLLGMTMMFDHPITVQGGSL
jgi:hypothetical protein